ncbi:hypothetical protein DIPPA_21850 [Diplonema papillatum]|nr:hypothetical protein DIPPA_21850 [Diplonema papillatum]
MRRHRAAPPLIPLLAVLALGGASGAAGGPPVPLATRAFAAAADLLLREGGAGLPAKSAVSKSRRRGVPLGGGACGGGPCGEAQECGETPPPGGFTCTCPDGSFAVGAAANCSSVDECAGGGGVCGGEEGAECEEGSRHVAGDFSCVCGTNRSRFAVGGPVRCGQEVRGLNDQLFFSGTPSWLVVLLPAVSVLCFALMLEPRAAGDPDPDPAAKPAPPEHRRRKPNLTLNPLMLKPSGVDSLRCFSEATLLTTPLLVPSPQADAPFGTPSQLSPYSPARTPLQPFHLTPPVVPLVRSSNTSPASAVLQVRGARQWKSASSPACYFLSPKSPLDAVRRSWFEDRASSDDLDHVVVRRSTNSDEMEVLEGKTVAQLDWVEATGESKSNMGKGKGKDPDPQHCLDHRPADRKEEGVFGDIEAFDETWDSSCLGSQKVLVHVMDEWDASYSSTRKALDQIPRFASTFFGDDAEAARRGETPCDSALGEKHESLFASSPVGRPNSVAFQHRMPQRRTHAARAAKVCASSEIRRMHSSIGDASKALRSLSPTDSTAASSPELRRRLSSAIASQYRPARRADTADGFRAPRASTSSETCGLSSSTRDASKALRLSPTLEPPKIPSVSDASVMRAASSILHRRASSPQRAPNAMRRNSDDPDPLSGTDGHPQEPPRVPRPKRRCSVDPSVKSTVDSPASRVISGECIIRSRRRSARSSIAGSNGCQPTTRDTPSSLDWRESPRVSPPPLLALPGPPKSLFGERSSNRRASTPSSLSTNVRV